MPCAGKLCTRIHAPRRRRAATKSIRNRKHSTAILRGLRCRRRHRAPPGTAVARAAGRRLPLQRAGGGTADPREQPRQRPGPDQAPFGPFPGRGGASTQAGRRQVSPCDPGVDKRDVNAALLPVRRRVGSDMPAGKHLTLCAGRLSKLSGNPGAHRMCMGDIRLVYPLIIDGAPRASAKPAQASGGTGPSVCSVERPFSFPLSAAPGVDATAAAAASPRASQPSRLSRRPLSGPSSVAGVLAEVE